MMVLKHHSNDLGVWIAVSVDVDVSLGVELTAAYDVCVEQEENMMMSNSNSNIMKNVKSGIVALLGRLVADSTSSELQTETHCSSYLGGAMGVQIPHVPPF